MFIILWIAAITGLLLTLDGFVYMYIQKKRKKDVKGWVFLRTIQVGIASFGVLCYIFYCYLSNHHGH